MSALGYNRYKHASTRTQTPVRTLSYVTWNRTNFPVPKGSRNLKVMAAIIAQKKLFEWSDIPESVVPGHIPSPHNFRGEEIRHFLQAEQDTTNRRAECNCNAGSGSSTQDLASLT